MCFNLGFLPGGDRAIITQPRTSVAAVRAALDIVRPGGLASVLAYTGHPGRTVSACPLPALNLDAPKSILHRLIAALQPPQAYVALHRWQSLVSNAPHFARG